MEGHIKVHRLPREEVEDKKGEKVGKVGWGGVRKRRLQAGLMARTHKPPTLPRGIRERRRARWTTTATKKWK